MTSFQKSEARRLYREGKSTVQIAELFNTFPNTIRRLLISSGEKLRGMSEAQSLSLRNGVRKNPTQGNPRPQFIRDLISETKRKKYWEKLGKDAREQIYQEAMLHSNSEFPKFIWFCLMRLGYGILLEADSSRIQIFSKKSFVYFSMDYKIEQNYSNFVIIPLEKNIKNYSICFEKLAAILETKINPNSLFIIEE